MTLACRILLLRLTLPLAAPTIATRIGRLGKLTDGLTVSGIFSKEIFVIPRRLLAVLVFTLPISAVVFGVVAGAALLADGMGDGSARTIFRAVAAVALIILTTDMILLVSVLGIDMLDRVDEHELLHGGCGDAECDAHGHEPSEEEEDGSAEGA